MEAPDHKVIDQITGQLMQDWGHQVVAMLRSRILSRKLIVTGDTLQSLKSDVLERTAQGTQQLLLSFLEEGRIKDMSSVAWQKRPPIEPFEEYVKKVGVAKFDYVPGYRKGNSPITQSKAINRIAWGIAMHKMQNHAWHPKKWFAKPFYGMIARLIDGIVTEYANTTGKVLAGEFYKKVNG